MGESGSALNLAVRCVLMDLLVGQWGREKLAERTRAAAEQRPPRRLANLATAIPAFGQILVGGRGAPPFDGPTVERVLGSEDINGIGVAGGLLSIVVTNLGPQSTDFMMARPRETESDRVVVVTTDDEGYQALVGLIALKEERFIQAFSRG